MRELIVRTSEDQVEFIANLMERLGAEVIQNNALPTPVKKKEMKKAKQKKRKESKVSPTYLFGAWRDLDIDPDQLRKQAWGRNQQ